jgi:HPt (histidine-containing phosphotransfer) domain-containing protein
VIELVEMYRTRAEAFLATADRGHANAGLADLAHQLAGASGPFGMTDITDAALRLESQLRDGQPHGDDLEVIVGTLPELLAELERWARGLSD